MGHYPGLRYCGQADVEERIVYRALIFWLLLTGCIVFPILAFLLSQGVAHEVTHCYITVRDSHSNKDQHFMLAGNVKNDTDIAIGDFKTIDEAKAAAEKISCTIK